MQFDRVALRKMPALVMLALVMVFPVCAAGQESEPGFPRLNWGADPTQVREILGTPAFAEYPVLIYSTQIETSDGLLPADLTLWFRTDTLFFASYAFPLLDRSNDDISSDFESISILLVATHGPPSSRATTAGSFITEVWNLPDLDISHTLILDTGRLDHVVSLTVVQE